MPHLLSVSRLCAGADGTFINLQVIWASLPLVRLHYAGYSRQSALDEEALRPMDLAGIATPATYIYPDIEAGNIGLCKFVASEAVMPQEPVTPQQNIGQLSAIDDYYKDPASTVYHALGNITAPVLVVAGTQDVILSVQDDYTLVNMIPGASFLQFADAGHAAIMQHAVTAGEYISAFLDA